MGMISNSGQWSSGSRVGKGRVGTSTVGSCLNAFIELMSSKVLVTFFMLFCISEIFDIFKILNWFFYMITAWVKKKCEGLRTLYWRLFIRSDLPAVFRSSRKFKCKQPKCFVFVRCGKYQNRLNVWFNLRNWESGSGIWELGCLLEERNIIRRSYDRVLF